MFCVLLPAKSSLPIFINFVCVNYEFIIELKKIIYMNFKLNQQAYFYAFQ